MTRSLLLALVLCVGCGSEGMVDIVGTLPPPCPTTYPFKDCYSIVIAKTDFREVSGRWEGDEIGHTFCSIPCTSPAWCADDSECAMNECVIGKCIEGVCINGSVEQGVECQDGTGTCNGCECRPGF